MAKVIILKCPGCGSSIKDLNLHNSVQCDSCKSFCSLVERDGVSVAISYYPLQKHKGKMETPLILKIATLVNRMDGVLVAQDDFSSYYMTVKDGKAVSKHKVTISANDDELNVYKTWVVESMVDDESSFFAVLKGKKVKALTPELEHALTIHVYEITNDDETLVGHGVDITVEGVQYEELANSISQKIIDEFGVVPTVELVEVEI